jgi:hypothetical protein
MKKSMVGGAGVLLVGHGTHPGTITASSVYDNRSASRAVDGVITDELNDWCSNRIAPHWIRYDFGSGNEKVVTRYLLMPRGIYNTPLNKYTRPYDFRFEGSNNGTNWDVLDTQSDQTYYDTLPFYSTNTLTLEPDFNEYLIDNTEEYRYYQLYITEVDPRGLDDYCCIGEWVMYGY